MKVRRRFLDGTGLGWSALDRQDWEKAEADMEGLILLVVVFLVLAGSTYITWNREK